MHQIILSSLYRCLLTTFCFPGCEHFKCLNGGQCIYDESSNESKCECIDPWIGNTCHLNSGNAIMNLKYERKGIITKEGSEYHDLNYYKYLTDCLKFR